MLSLFDLSKLKAFANDMTDGGEIIGVLHKMFENVVKAFSPQFLQMAFSLESFKPGKVW